MGDFAFDEDSRVVAAGPEGVFAAELTGRWNGTAGAVNGGYMLATCVRALALGMPFPDPIVVSGFFLRPGTAGPDPGASAKERRASTWSSPFPTGRW